MRALALVLFAFVCTGCGSQMAFGRATTLEPGKNQITGFAQVDVSTPKLGGGEERAVAVPWAHVGLGYRRGITRSFDLGVRGWIFGLPSHLSFGGALDAKVQLVRGEPGRGLSIATGGSLGYHQAQLGGTPWHQFTVWAPLLFGQDFGKHQFVVGPRGGFTLWTGEGQNPIKLPWFGGSTGVSFGAGKNQIMPELVVVYSPVTFNGEQEQRTGAFLVQLGLSGTFTP